MIIIVCNIKIRTALYASREMFGKTVEAKREMVHWLYTKVTMRYILVWWHKASLEYVASGVSMVRRIDSSIVFGAVVRSKSSAL